MSRAHIIYDQVVKPPTLAVPPQRWADEFEQGFYRIRRAVWRPVAIWFGQPLDPVTAEVMDRSYRWNVYYCGRAIADETLVWPVCKKYQIERAEYQYLMARLRHADEHDPRDPHASKTKRIDWLNSTPPTF